MGLSLVAYYIVGVVSMLFSIGALAALWSFLYKNNNINTRLLIHLHSGQLIETICSFPNSQRLPCAIFTTLRNYGSLYMCYTLLAMALHCYNILFEQKHSLSVWVEVAIVILPASVLANVQNDLWVETAEGFYCIHKTDKFMIAFYFAPLWGTLFLCFALFCIMLRKVLSLGTLEMVLKTHSNFIVYLFYDAGLYIFITFFFWMPKSFYRLYASWSFNVYYLFYLTNFIVGILYGIVFQCTRHRVIALATYYQDVTRLSDGTDKQLNLDDILRSSASGRGDASGDYGLWRERDAASRGSLAVSQAAQYILGLPASLSLYSASTPDSTARMTRTGTELVSSRPSSRTREASGETALNPMVGVEGEELSKGHIVL